MCGADGAGKGGSVALPWTRPLPSVAQGVPELQQAFRPLHAAVEAGLAECHQANLAEAPLHGINTARFSPDSESEETPFNESAEASPCFRIGVVVPREHGHDLPVCSVCAVTQAVFGRRAATPRGLLGTLPLGENGRGAVGAGGRERGGVGVGGRTAAAARHLAAALSALDGDVRAAALLAKQGESLRAIAKWAAWKPATASAPAAQPPLASALTLSRPERAAPPGSAAAGGGGSGDRSSAGTSSSEETGEGYDGDPREDWAMRVFRARGGESSSNPRTASATSAAAAGAGARPSSSLVVVKALRTNLPKVPWPPAPTASNNGATPTASDRGGPSAVVSAGKGSAWRGPLSWLTGGRRGAAAAPGESARRAVARPPAPSLPGPPRVVVRVVYSALAQEMLRLVMESERRGVVAPAAATVVDADGGRDTRAAQRGQDGLGLDGARGGSSASVELLRSEVRVRHVGLVGAACSGAGDGEREPRAAGVEEVEPGPESYPVMQLQNIHEDDGERHRVRRDCRGGKSPTGGGRSSGVGEEVGGGARGDSTTGGCGTAGIGVRGTARGDRANDVVPLEWGDAPVELCPPEASAERECEPQLKVGTAHLLGINIALPPAPAPRLAPHHHPRPRRRRDAAPEKASDTPPPPRNSSPHGTADATSTSPMPVSPSGSGSDYGEGGEAGAGSRVRRGVDSLRRRTGSAEEEEGRRSSSGKKRPRPEPGEEAVVAVPADRRGGGGRGDEVVVDPRRVGDGGRRGAAAAATPAVAATGERHPCPPGGGSDEPDDEERNEEAERANKRRRKAGWAWGLLRLWNRSGQRHDDDDHHRVGAACPGADGTATAEPPRDRRQETRQSSAKASSARTAERRSDEQRDQECHEVEHDYGDGRLGRARADRGRAREIPRDRGRDRAPAAAPPRRSPLVITVVLTPPPPPPPPMSPS
ncbi:expressed unknown protein [Ectocarpus siliculosus]|uniref:Uncharacterized protein n=1 Tax=Ectocarpus siliculosus TaxID=2880 RepID=D7FYH9_ECTSI|nr:expressed unknown protein [Ectocarpus siliculosus]|eukprot:CBJ32521.1 expressed unknown protein [Ectocarpus siliculosus]